MGRTIFGSWGPISNCPEFGKVDGFRLRMDDATTALNSIELNCVNGGVINPHKGYWGEWTQYQKCSQGTYITGAMLKSEPGQGWWGDDSAANNLKIKCSDGLDDKFEPVGPSLSCLDLRDQQLPRVFLLAFIHRPAGTVRLDWLFCPLSDDLDVELICRILLFPIGLPRLLQLPSITDYVAFEHRHHLSVIPARVSIVCL